MEHEYVTAKWGMEMLNETKPKKFWMITGDGNSPKVRHASRQLAQNEAERLARLYPGQEFFILETVSLVQQPAAMYRYEF